jgi:alkylation response protein AidB-like acyl-CoA dehydrogenase
MFDLSIADDTSSIVELVHGFAERELRGAAREAEKARAVPAALASALHALGVTCPIPEALGGQGEPDLVTYLMVAEELAWGDPGIAYAALGAGHAALLIARCGTPEQQRALLPRFLGADAPVASVLLYEGFGRAPSEVRARAEPSEGGWRLSGFKFEALLPAHEGVCAIIARRADTGEIAAFAAQGTPRGVLVKRDDRRIGRIALCCAPSGAVLLEGVELPRDALLAGSGELDLARALARVRLTLPALAIGCARASLEFARHYATERVAFGRPIAAFQGVAFPLADSDMAVDAARLELWEVARAVERTDDIAAIERLTASAIAHACEAALQATREGVQTLGGHGFITDYPIERWYRCAAALAAIDFDPAAAPAVAYA